MANLSELTENVAYACKCLNVRITPSTPPSDPPDYPPSKDYAPVFVADDGILVAHPQVTVRISTKGEPIPGTSRCSRFTAVTCLFCDLAIYRVHQIISEEVDLKDSVLLPTEEWVEHDVMKSASGWIDVHKDALSRERISQAQSSADYASIFSLLLPSTSTSTSPSSLRKSLAKDDVQFKPPKEESNEEPTTPNYLSDMLPLYLPPPFTPSHPIFALLADIADKESKRLRSEAEQRIANFIKTEITGVEAMEQRLRSQVEALWKSFRGHLSEVQERNQRSSTARSPVRGSERFSTNGMVSPARMSSSVTVRSFVPVSVNPVSHPPTASSVPRVSALSASLATTSFHHPRHSQSQSPTGPVTRSSVESSSSKTLSSTPSGSSTLVQGNHLVEGHTIINLKRNVDDTVNTQASFRYFVNLEEDMARHKRQQAEAMLAQGTGQTEETQPGPSNSVSGSVGRKLKKAQAAERASSRERPAPEHDAGPTRGRDKGKRKVTFDVEPAVVTIQTNKEKAAGDEKEIASSEDPREMIFPMEDLENSTNGDINEQATAMSLPLVEQPAARPPRPHKLRSPNTTALLESFASLRPSSLPNPSYIRPVRSSPGMDSSPSIVLSLPRPSNMPSSAETSQTTSKASSTVPSPTTLSERDIELRKLVAADTPSHRGAWTPDSKAWQMFSRRQSSKEEISQSDSTGEPESPEGEVIHIIKRSVPSSREDSHDDDENHFDESRRMVAGSLPVNINRIKPREPLSLASYKAPNTITEEPQDPAASASAPTHAQKPLSSAAIRKATYLERDRSRSMDPGTLDFPSEEEDDSESESDVVENEPFQSGERGRKQALKILQARSELPEEGMWRSLANDAPFL